MMSDEITDVKTCLTCSNKATSRGLCRACYSIARLRVNSKVTTWKWLEDHDLALPSSKPERKSKFTAAFDTAQEADATDLSQAEIDAVAASIRTNPPTAPSALVPQGYDADGNPNPPSQPVPQAVRYVDASGNFVDVNGNLLSVQEPSDYAPPPAGAEVPGRSQPAPGECLGQIVQQQPASVSARPWEQPRPQPGQYPDQPGAQ